MTPDAPLVPAAISDPVNAAILAVSEDRLTGFQEDPFGAIAAQSGVPVETVMERIVAMLRGGTIRRVRQTMMSTNLAEGALVAWEVPNDKLDAAFDYLFNEDPFSGHVVIRTTDTATPGSSYRLWTTLKVPQGYSLRKHAAFLAREIGAARFRLMPAKMVFALGVGHVRRRGLEPGARAEEFAEPKNTAVVDLTEKEWRVMTALKREFAPEETHVFNQMIQTLVLDGDGAGYRRVLEDVGLLRDGADLTTDQVVEYFGHFYALVREPGPFTVGSDYASETVRRIFDRTSPVAAAVDLPPMFVIVQRINLGLYALLARLGATADWRRIAEELWPMTDGPPSTELGRLEAAWARQRVAGSP